MKAMKPILLMILALISLASASPSDTLNQAIDLDRAFLSSQSFINTSHTFVAIAPSNCTLPSLPFPTPTKTKHIDVLNLYSLKLTPAQLATLLETECVYTVGDEANVDSLTSVLRILLGSKIACTYTDYQTTLASEYTPSPIQYNVRQVFITPNDPVIKSLANRLHTPQLCYAESSKWVYFSDEELYNTLEHWDFPADFLLNTSSLPTNPTNYPASDCEEKAFTLTSLLRCLDFDARTCIGKLGSFDDGISGHAWVEVYDGSSWFQLDPSSTSLNKSNLNQRNGLPYNFYHTYSDNIYPVLAYSTCFNEKYFIDFTSSPLSPPSYPAHWTKHTVIKQSVASLFEEPSVFLPIQRQIHTIKSSLESLIPPSLQSLGREYWFVLLIFPIIWLVRKF